MINNEDLKILIRAIQDNSFRLGLKWDLSIGTIIEFSPLTIRLDGDTVNLNNEITNLTGQRLNNGDRVYCLIVPPNTIYIIGYAGVRKKGCTLRRVALQTLNDATVTTISWDTEDEDTSDMWSGGGNITIPYTGLWAATLSVDLTTTAGRTYLELENFGGFTSVRSPIEDTGGTRGSITAIAPMNESNVFSCKVFRDAASGGTMTARLTCYRVDGG